jgi:N-acetylglucosaminyl-diphospho-decaprenol L-rhamnosyltransferase
MDLSIAIVSWNTRDLLRQCLGSLPAATGRLAYEAIVVDNGSTDGSPEMVRQEFPEVRLVENGENLGFVHATNQAIARSRGRYILLLNSDAVALPHSLERMVEFMERQPDAGAAGPKLLNPDGSFQASYAHFPTWVSEGISAAGLNRQLYGPSHPSPPPQAGETRQPVDWVPGTCLLVRRQVIEQIGALDETFWMYSEDTDLCYRIHQAGWRVYYLPDVEVQHFGGASSRQRRPESVALLYESKLRFLHKHRGALPFHLLRGIILWVYLVKAILAMATWWRAAARAQARTAWLVWQRCLGV